MKLLNIIIGITLSVTIGSSAYAAFPYSVSNTVAAGDTILAAHLNTSNSEHINNNIPESIDDYSANATEMQSTADPFSGATESLATTLDGEIQRLRYMIGALNYRNTYWYQDTNPIPIFRGIALKIQPGATPNTNINVTDLGATLGYNVPTINDATDLGNDATSGSFTLNSGSTTLTMNLTEDIIGILGVSTMIHDINSSSTSEMYTVRASIASSNLILEFIKRGSSTDVDIRTIFDAGDRMDIQISLITSS